MAKAVYTGEIDEAERAGFRPVEIHPTVSTNIHDWFGADRYGGTRHDLERRDPELYRKLLVGNLSGMHSLQSLGADLTRLEQSHIPGISEMVAAWRARILPILFTMVGHGAAWNKQEGNLEYVRRLSIEEMRAAVLEVLQGLDMIASHDAYAGNRGFMCVGTAAGEWQDKFASLVRETESIARPFTAVFNPENSQGGMQQIYHQTPSLRLHARGGNVNSVFDQVVRRGNFDRDIESGRIVRPLSVGVQRDTISCSHRDSLRYQRIEVMRRQKVAVQQEARTEAVEAVA